MPQQTIHQYQVFPALLAMFLIAQNEPLFAVFDHVQLRLGFALFSGLALCVSLIHHWSPLIKTLVVIFLTLSTLMTLNVLTPHPSVGTLLTIAVGWMVGKILTKGTSAAKKSGPSAGAFVSSLVIYFILYAVLSPQRFFHVAVYHYIFILGAISVLRLGLTFSQTQTQLKTVAPIAVALLAMTLLYFEASLSLLILSRFMLLLTFGLSIYLLVKFRPLAHLEKSYVQNFSRPEWVVLGFFILVATVGAFALQFNIAQAQPFAEKHAFLDSLFTATSAVCVTGLIVLDTPVDFSFWGQLIIVLLIQIGGLGISSLSAWVLMFLSSGRLTLSHEDTLQGQYGDFEKMNVQRLLGRIFKYFLTIELLGAFFLFFAFLSDGEYWYVELWRAIFTSVSAFCNAGFALQSDSLVAYQSRPWVLFIISALIVGGNFAPLMAFHMFRRLRLGRLSLQAKIVLASTATLIGLGFVFFWLVEQDHSLAGLSFTDGLANAWFQSITARTAGFNSVDFTTTRSVTQLFFLLLMFIGGNPGSTAGGVKTLTVAVLGIAAFSAVKKYDHAIAFNKKISNRIIFQALLIVILGIFVHLVSFLFLSLTQKIDTLSLLFETFSALGTVGLSTGATGQLDGVGKLIIIFCMLAGRVGPLTFLLLLVNRKPKYVWKVPQEEVSLT